MMRPGVLKPFAYLAIGLGLLAAAGCGRKAHAGGFTTGDGIPVEMNIDDNDLPVSNGY